MRISKYWPLTYLPLLALYGSVGFRSFGYEDETFNIWAVEKYGLEVVTLVQRTDVHPPGSYFLDWVLLTTRSEWHLFGSSLHSSLPVS